MLLGEDLVRQKRHVTTSTSLSPQQKLSSMCLRAYADSSFRFQLHAWRTLETDQHDHYTLYTIVRMTEPRFWGIDVVYALVNVNVLESTRNDM